ncbi:MAG: hypothetical protein WC551_07770 [Patescibacteria group bacterium]
MRRELRRVLSGAYGRPSDLKFDVTFEDGSSHPSDPAGVQTMWDQGASVSLRGHAPMTFNEASLAVAASGSPLDRQ